MKETVKKEEIKNVTGGAAETVRDITDEKDLNAALKEMNIPLNNADLARNSIQKKSEDRGGSKCPTCPSQRKAISVLQ